MRYKMMALAMMMLAGTGAAMADQTFRLMDPDSHRMMGLRADMTQVWGGRFTVQRRILAMDTVIE